MLAERNTDRDRNTNTQTLAKTLPSKISRSVKFTFTYYKFAFISAVKTRTKEGSFKIHEAEAGNNRNLPGGK